ncbi:MAG: molybdopterin-dependent oxidoreductase [Acidobacteria bacterium]|nr:molybdopterin-dependent oxidoreductase [Acidobacteriota bacterium]
MRATIRTHTKKALQETARKPCEVARNLGNVDAEFARGGRTHEAESCAASGACSDGATCGRGRNSKTVAWSLHPATQNPQAVQDAVSKALGMGEKNVECHMLALLGGGFRQNPSQTMSPKPRCSQNPHRASRSK